MAQLGFPYFNYDEVYPNRAAMVKAINNEGDWSSRIGRYLMVNYYYNGVKGTVGGDNIYNGNALTDISEFKQDLTFERKNWHGTVWQIVKTVEGLQLLFIGDTSVGKNLTPNKMAITAENGRITSLDSLQTDSTYTSTNANGILQGHKVKPGTFARINEKGIIQSNILPNNQLLYTAISEGSVTTLSDSLEPYAHINGFPLKSNSFIYVADSHGSDDYPILASLDLPINGILTIQNKQPQFISEPNSLLYTNNLNQLSTKLFKDNEENITTGLLGIQNNNDDPIQIYDISGSNNILVSKNGAPQRSDNVSQGDDQDTIYYDDAENKVKHKQIYDGLNENLMTGEWQWQSDPNTIETGYFGFNYPYYTLDSLGHISSINSQQVLIQVPNLSGGAILNLDYNDTSIVNSNG